MRSRFLLMLALAGHALLGQEAFPMEARNSFQTIDLPFPGERMGLYGLEFMHETPSGFAAGLGGYGAITGKRGGFITVGLAGGWRPRITDRLSLDIGLFSGGGGAGRAAVGGGWMVEGHGGVDVRLDRSRIGLAYQRIWFPNGAIDSRQWRLSLALPFSLPAMAQATPLPAMPWREVDIETTVLHYAPTAEVRRLDGTPGIEGVSLVGFATRGSLRGPFFFSLELAAAHSGEADGYMEGLLGLGIQAKAGGWRLHGRFAGGPVGGGHLDVGGGMAWKAAAGLERDLGAGIYLGVEAGMMATPGASFKAAVTQLSLGRRFRLADEGGEPPEPGWTLDALPLRIRAGLSELTHPRRGAADDGTPVRSQTLALDLPFSGPFYVTGQAAFGTSGRAGGWATGLVGLGVESSPFGSGPKAFAELLLGAGGGGGLDSRGGAIIQPMAGLAQKLGRDWELQLRGGRLKSLRGGIDSTVLEIAVGWRTGLAIVAP